jgi:hypothetical protein
MRPSVDPGNAKDILVPYRGDKLVGILLQSLLQTAALILYPAGEPDESKIGEIEIRNRMRGQPNQSLLQATLETQFILGHKTYLSDGKRIANNPVVCPEPTP